MTTTQGPEALFPLRTLPLVPLRDMVVFPRMMAPFVVGRGSSIAALEASLALPDKQIFLSAQRDPKVDEPAPGDIYEIGVLATVVQSLKLPNGHIKVMVEGTTRGRIRRWITAPDHLSVGVVRLDLRTGAVTADVRRDLPKLLGVF